MKNSENQSHPTNAQKAFVIICSCLTLAWFWFGMIELFPRVAIPTTQFSSEISGNLFLQNDSLRQINNFRQQYIPQNTTPQQQEQVAMSRDIRIRPALSRDMVHSLNDVTRQYRGSTASFYEEFYSSASKDHCVDSDGGINYALKGTVTWNKDEDLKLSFTDRVLGKNDLLEFYCEDGKLHAQSMTCPVEVLGATCIRSSQAAEYMEFFHSAEKEFSTTQIIRLKRGWNWLSFSITPYSTLVSELFEPLYENDEEFIIKNEGGELYWPKMEINTLNEMDFAKPYQIYVSRALEIEIPGSDLVYPFYLSFEEGWNFMGYPHFEEANVQCVLQPLIDKGYLWAAKDFDGRTFTFVNGQWENEIGKFQPGKAYQIYLHNMPEETVELSFPETWDCQL